jgi:predicted nuclease of predicted toxin-antitoxin system
MLRLLADENFNGAVVRGLLLRRPAFDVVRVQDVGLSGAPDPAVLAWAGANDRIVLTHDYRTMPDDVADRIKAGEPMPGLFVVNADLSIRQTIDELLLTEDCSEHAEWSNRILRFPLRA